MNNNETQTTYEPSRSNESKNASLADESAASPEHADLHKRGQEPRVTLLEKWGFNVESRVHYLDDGTVVERPETPEAEVKVFDPWHVYTTADAFKEPEKAPWVIDNLLMEHSATLVSAQPKAMKSLSLLQACMEAVAKQTVWGKLKAPSVRRSLFIETEDTIQLVNARVRGLSRGLGLKPGEELEGFHYACVGPFRLVEEEERLSRLFDQYKPDFAVLSTLQNLLGEANWNTQHDMQPIMQVVIKLARQCPLFLVTHSPQDKNQKRAAGSITQAANFAGALHYEKRFANGVTTVHVRADSKAGAGLPQFSLRLETEGPAGNPESVRRLVFDSKGTQSTRTIIQEAYASDPDVTVAELMEIVDTGERNIQKILADVKAKAKLKRAA